MRYPAVIALCMGLFAGMQALAGDEAGPADPLGALLAEAGLARPDVAPDPHRLGTSPTHRSQLPFHQALMRAPLDAPYRVGLLHDTLQRHQASPHALFSVISGLMGLEVFIGLPVRAHAVPPEWCSCESEWRELPVELRPPLADLLWAIDTAKRFRERAFARLPESLTPTRLIRQVVEADMALFESPDFRVELAKIEQAALMAGMQTLVAAVEHFVEVLERAETLPRVRWRQQTALGEIVLDTLGSDNHHVLLDPLLIVDISGNDRYTLRNSLDPVRGRISVLIDLEGDDTYEADGVAADAAGAVLGYGILWDAGGNDRHTGTHLAQGAAVFGMSLLASHGGSDHFQARGHAQGYALGGAALLLNRGGDDHYEAITHAQGAGGPGGVGLLVDAAGDDRYILGNDPLDWPSLQSALHNVSMGQGAGHGWRADSLDGRSLAGGIGGLFDFAGDDHYEAQVFAQGAGFWEGTGLLVDGGGSDHLDAVWYAMGAAAHRAVGIFLSLGQGDDTYRVSHATSLGAAHDLSVGVFVDEAGDDHYRLGETTSPGELGFGAASENGVALFADLAGNDEYEAPSPRCLAFGVARMQAQRTLREVLPGVGLFLDLGGRDHYPTQCDQPQENALWQGARHQSQLNLPSEIGLGVDGEYPTPFRLRPWRIP
ncbi:MAG TPA: hypothetical protein PLN31_10390 [Azoarcus taiwanensis]|nr:hypothetical protein [Azoarcus taiwanensis]